MIILKSVSKAKLAEAFRGTDVAHGNALTNGAGSPDVQDLTTDAFADVSEGDRFYISGEDPVTVFLVDTKTDDNNLILDDNVVNAHALPGSPANWRACKPDGIDPASLVMSPAQDNNVWDILYDSGVFGG